MASDTDSGNDEDLVVLQCRDPYLIEASEQKEEGAQEMNNPSGISISTAEISTWDMEMILSHRVVRVETSRTRLIEQASYFRGLLSGSFSESQNRLVSIEWSIGIVLDILRFIYGFHSGVTCHNFLQLLQGALYFGVETLLLECRSWFSDNFSDKVVPSSQIQLDFLVHVWTYGLEQGIDLISRTCTSYIARNFMWAMACDSFIDVPYDLLISCIKHPLLTVDSERHLSEAILAWLHANVDSSKHKRNSEFNWIDILEEVRIYLLPVWFVMEKQKCCYFAGLAQQSVGAILGAGGNDLSCWRIRLTEFTKKLDLSGCPQINSAIFLLSLLPISHDLDLVQSLHSEIIGVKLTDLRSLRLNSISTPQQTLKTLSFDYMMEIDISKCPRFHLFSTLEYFGKSFPSLKTLIACHFLDFKTRHLQLLGKKCPSICEVDLTVDLSLTMPSQVSVLYSDSEIKGAVKRYSDVLPSVFGQTMSNVTKLTLEGRTDFNDFDLFGLLEACVSLGYLNIKGCFCISDIGISNLLRKCIKLHSIIADDTLFGRKSALALCERFASSGSLSLAHLEEKVSKVSGVYLELLHIGGCKGVDQASLNEILSHPLTHKLKSLCLRDTCTVDTIFNNFLGISLEMLDVSNTMMSGASLSHITGRNSKLRCLKARGCNGLCPQSEVDYALSRHGKLYIELANTCSLEVLEIGWGFSHFWLETLKPAIRSLKSLTVGLGGSLGEEGVMLLPTLCPVLESVTLLFQVISERAMTNLMGMLTKLQALEICYCMGDISRECFKFNVPQLRRMRLERVTSWMTNKDLTLLTQKIPNLIDLSFIGCRYLDADSQQIISQGWPGLISLHLEKLKTIYPLISTTVKRLKREKSTFVQDCGSITSEGIVSLFDCKALEDLLLRHNGLGIKRNFILKSASELPMLRKISVDWCDAMDGDFDLPDFTNRCSLSSVKISRCKLRSCGLLHVKNLEVQRRPMHCETLVLEWNSSSLRRTVVKERIS